MKRVWLAMTVLVACTKKDPPAPPPIASAVESVSPVAVAPSVADLVAPAEDSFETPLATLKTTKGTITAWAVGDQVVASLDKGAPKLLRKTSGKVGAVAVAEAANGDVAVAWASELTAGGAQLFALVTASPDLARVSPPTTVAMVGAAVQERSHVGLAANPRGGWIVAHQGPPAKCPFGGHMDDCVSFEVKTIDTSGVVTKSASEKLDGGPSPEYRMIDIDGKWLGVVASSMRGGRTLATVSVRYDPGEGVTPVKMPMCSGLAAFFPEYTRGTNGEIVSVCATDVDGKKLDVDAVMADGKPAPKGAVKRVECTGGHPRLVFASGSIELTKPTSLVCPK